MADVRSGTILPVLSDFRSFDGTPLYVNRTTGRGYILNSVDGIVPLVADWLGMPFNVLNYGATGDGVTDDGAALTAALDDAETSGGGTLYVPKGTYSYASSPNFARANVSLLCDRGAVFNHTGTGYAFLLDGGTGVGLYGLRFHQVEIYGTSNSTYGAYVQSLHHCYFEIAVHGAAATGAGIHCEGCLANEWSTPRVSSNEGAFGSTPLYGMFFTRKTTGGNVDSNANTILNPVMEGLTNTGGTGLYFDYANSNKVVGGTSEGNKEGVHFTSHAQRNAVTGIDLESNADYDIYCEGSYNFSYGINASGIVRFTSGNASWNSVIGGLVNQLTLDTNAAYNTILGITTGSTGGTLTDTGTKNYKANNFDGVNGVLFAESAKRTEVIATASLPGAAGAMDGTVLIEDGGAGVGNLVAYKGGQRFRYVGVAF